MDVHFLFQPIEQRRLHAVQPIRQQITHDPPAGLHPEQFRLAVLNESQRTTGSDREPNFPVQRELLIAADEECGNVFLFEAVRPTGRVAHPQLRPTQAPPNRIGGANACGMN